MEDPFSKIPLEGERAHEGLWSWSLRHYYYFHFYSIVVGRERCHSLWWRGGGPHQAEECRDVAHFQDWTCDVVRSSPSLHSSSYFHVDYSSHYALHLGNSPHHPSTSSRVENLLRRRYPTNFDEIPQTTKSWKRNVVFGHLPGLDPPRVFEKDKSPSTYPVAWEGREGHRSRPLRRRLLLELFPCLHRNLSMGRSRGHLQEDGVSLLRLLPECWGKRHPSAVPYALVLQRWWWKLLQQEEVRKEGHQCHDSRPKPCSLHLPCFVFEQRLVFPIVMVPFV